MAYIFNSKIENPERLERMLVARRPLVELLEKRAKVLIDKGTLSQTLLIGPRGSGKTHMLKVFFNRVWSNPKREEKIVVAYMVEDEYGIDTFLDLLIRIFNAFMRWYENDETKQLAEEIEKLKHTNPDQRESYAIDILNRYLAGRDLLIIIENLNDIFQGLGKQGQAKLRDYIQQYNNTAIFASSQALFSDIQQEDKPFQNFFNITHLKKLSYEEAMLLVNALAEEEKLEDFKAFLDTPRGKANVHAVFDLTQGNHRLLVTFFDFLKAEFKSDLAEAFLHTIDKLKPYYESYFKLLSPQQQKIVQYLSSKRKPVTGKDISLNSFIPHTTVSKQMSELQKLGYVESTKVGKEAFYEIAEPMLRLAFEVSENKKGIISIFIDFLTQLYEVEEITKRYLRFKYMSHIEEGKLKLVYLKEASFYKEALRGNAPDGLNEFEETLENFHHREEVENYLKNLHFKTSDDSNGIDYERIIELSENGDFNNALIEVEKMISTDPLNSSHYFHKAYVQYMDKKYLESIDSLERAQDLEHPSKDTVWVNIALNHLSLRNFEKAVIACERALKIDPKFYAAWFNLGIALKDLEKYKDAKLAFQRCVDLKPEESSAWHNLAKSSYHLEEFALAEEYYFNAMKKGASDSMTYSNLGHLYWDWNKPHQAIKQFQKAIELTPSDSDLYFHLGQLYFELDEPKKAESYLMKATTLNPNSVDPLILLITVNINQKDLENAAKLSRIGLENFEGHLFFHFVLSLIDLLENDLTSLESHVKNWLEKAQELKSNHVSNFLELIKAAAMLLEKREFQIFTEMVFRQFKPYNREKELNSYYSSLLFDLLKQDDIKKEALNRINTVIQNSSLDEDLKGMWNKFLPVGVEYYIDRNNKALLKLTKEERQIFHSFIETNH